jgi:hypothetical protein
MTELFVSRICTAYPPQGQAFVARIGVFAPAETEQQAWQCKLSLDGILDEERLGFGVATFERMNMAPGGPLGGTSKLMMKAGYFVRLSSTIRAFVYVMVNSI